MSATDLTYALLAAVSALALWLLWRAFHLGRMLHREQEENRRLRSLLQTGSQTAQSDLAQLRQLRHDLRQYLILAEDLSAPAEAAAALREALDTAPSTGGRESWAVSALERHYQERALAMGFRSDLKILPPHSWDGILPDFCLLLGNLLENSLESLQREGGGWVRARSVSTAGYFSLVVGNTCTKPLRVRGGRYLSSKAPGRAGIGLETIREIAERYGGQAEFTVKDGEFRASVFLPRPSSSLSENAAPVEDTVLVSPQS